jgi:hypothetical protein
LGVDQRAVDVINRLNGQGWIAGRSILTIGRQSINVSINNPSTNELFQFKWLDDLLLHLGALRVDSIDVSDYEGATIVFDLQAPTNESYKSRWNVVIDFGTAEHIFDQKAAFQNIFSFLKNGGLYVGILPRTNWNDHGLYQYTPEFFWSLRELFYLNIECATVDVDAPSPSYYLYHKYGLDPEFMQEVLKNRTYVICMARKCDENNIESKLATSPRYHENFHKPEFAGLQKALISKLEVSDFIRQRIPEGPKKIGIIHIATGKYRQFTERFISSALGGIESSQEKIFYVISDATEELRHLAAKYNCKIRFLQIENEPWPRPTLMRFHYILRFKKSFHEDEISHLFFVNANAVFISANPVQELEKSGKQLGFVCHPGYLNDPDSAPFEKRPESKAYISSELVKNNLYVQGFFYGGLTSAFLELALELIIRIDDDLEKGITAIWHDESHLNWAHIMRWRDSSMIFDSGFAYPEGWRLDSPCRILSIDKSKVMDVSFKEIAR